MIQWVGYAGSALIAISLMMGNIWRLRWVNLFGAATFATYGLTIRAWPVAILNSFIVLVDIWHLSRLARRRDEFRFFRVDPDSRYLEGLLTFWHDEVDRFFPGFGPDHLEGTEVRLVLRNMLPVGVFAWRDVGDGDARVILDWVTPDYRDLKNARFVLGAAPSEMGVDGIRRLVAKSSVPAHQKYLMRVGFVQLDPMSSTFVRSL